MKFIFTAGVAASTKGVTNVYPREKLSHTKVYAPGSSRQHWYAIFCLPVPPPPENLLLLQYVRR